MNSIVRTVAVIVALSTPLASFAQSNDQITRQEVHSQLVQVGHAGYQPGRKDVKYPTDLQTADARISDGYSNTNSVGGIHNETSLSNSGAPHSLDANSMYSHR